MMFFCFYTGVFIMKKLFLFLFNRFFLLAFLPFLLDSSFIYSSCITCDLFVNDQRDQYETSINLGQELTLSIYFKGHTKKGGTADCRVHDWSSNARVSQSSQIPGMVLTETENKISKDEHDFNARWLYSGTPTTADVYTVIFHAWHYFDNTTSKECARDVVVTVYVNNPAKQNAPTHATVQKKSVSKSHVEVTVHGVK